MDLLINEISREAEITYTIVGGRPNIISIYILVVEGCMTVPYLANYFIAEYEHYIKWRIRERDEA